MRGWVRWCLSVLIISGGLTIARAENAVAVRAGVPTTRNLAADARLVEKERVPLLLVFARERCDYCEKLEREILNPYYVTGAFDGKVIARRFMIDSFGTVIDFDGTRVDADVVRTRLKVYAIPTVLLLDARGHELVERIVGINDTHFFTAYFDQSIDDARAKLRQH